MRRDAARGPVFFGSPVLSPPSTAPFALWLVVPLHERINRKHTGVNVQSGVISKRRAAYGAPNVVYLAECRFTDDLPAHTILEAPVVFQVEGRGWFFIPALRVDSVGISAQGIVPTPLLFLVPARALVQGRGVRMSQAHCTTMH